MKVDEYGQFVRSYSQVLLHFWFDKSFQGRMKENAPAVLKEFGLDPGSARVEIVPEVAGDPSIDEQVRLWEAGRETGTITLYLPSEPPAFVSEVELTEERVAGLIAGDSCCCCCSCCPCCCC